MKKTQILQQEASQATFKELGEVEPKNQQATGLEWVFSSFHIGNVSANITGD